MIVRVLLFGHFRDALPEAARVNGFQMDLPAGATPAVIAARLAADNPRFEDILANTRVAVGAEFAAPDTKLADGDEVAFLPPMSGG